MAALWRLWRAVQPGSQNTVLVLSTSDLDELQVRERSDAEVWYVLEGGAGDLGVAPADRAALRSALSAAQRRRAVEVAPV